MADTTNSTPTPAPDLARVTPGRRGLLRGAGQRHAGQPAVGRPGASAMLADGLPVLLQCGAMPALGDGRVRRQLAGEDEVAAGVLDGGSNRLAGEQVVAAVDRPQMHQRRPVPVQASLGGIALAVLLRCPVLSSIRRI